MKLENSFYVMNLKFVFIHIGILIFGLNLYSQHGEGHEHTEFEAPVHKVSLVMANALINQVLEDNSNGLRLVPVYGLNYDYMFHKKWAIGLHSDIIIQQFQIESHGDHEELVRENPIALCGVLTYKPFNKVSLLAGYGVEIESHENLQIIRVGVEYGIHLPENWELGILLEYDYKLNTYGSLMFGVGFSKLFPGH